MALLTVLCALLLLLVGCARGSFDPEDLFTLPQPPDDYRSLRALIDEVLRETGGESIAPATGTNTQTVQLQDLDGDGRQDSAVAFFRVQGAEKPLKIYIFKRQKDDSYVLDTIVEGVGASINSVSYENVGGSAAKEIIVSWQISATDHTLGVYSQDDLEGIEMLWVDRYARYRVSDMDLDGERELTVLTLSSGEEDTDRADFYDFDGAALALRSTVSLSQGIGEINSVRGGYLTDGIPAVFVTSTFKEEAGQGQVVDVLACRDGQLCNITMDSETKRSEETVRSYTAVSGFDINGDTVMELPRPVRLHSFGGADPAWLLDWRQFDVKGNVRQVCTTYHNVTDGWYFEVPGDWKDKVIISRKDSTTADERAVVFSVWSPDGAEPKAFLTLYKLTGTNQTTRANFGKRVSMFAADNATYAYEMNTSVWDTGLTHDDMLARLHVIREAWSADY